MLDVIIHVSLFFLVIITLYPILHIASVSFSSSSAYLKGIVTFYPREFTVKTYRMILSAGMVPNSFKNSVIYTSVGTVVNLLLTALTAYPLSKKRLTFRSAYMVFIIFTMFFSGGLIPMFLVVRNLGLYNSMWALILPTAVVTWYMIILRTFFQTIPDEIEDSAYMDGANDIRIFISIILPLSKAGLATIALFYAVKHWNSWFNALIYLKSSAKYPLQLVLREIIIQGQMAEELAARGDFSRLKEVDESMQVTSDGIKYATLFISIIPMLIIYPFIQKYFVKGVMIGSLKG